MIIYDLELATTEQQADDFVRLLTQTMHSCRGEPGCLLYRFSADLNDSRLFYLSEWWEEEVDLLAHVGAPPFLEFLAKLPRFGRIVSSVARQGDLTSYTRPVS